MTKIEAISQVKNLGFKREYLYLNQIDNEHKMLFVYRDNNKNIIKKLYIRKAYNFYYIDINIKKQIYHISNYNFLYKALGKISYFKNKFRQDKINKILNSNIS